MSYANPYPNQYSMPVPEHPQATTVLILGIVSLFALVTAPFAWYLGSKARKEMREYPGRYAESSSLTIGWILGMVMSIMGVVTLVFIAITLFVVFTALAS